MILLAQAMIIEYKLIIDKPRTKKIVDFKAIMPFL